MAIHLVGSVPRPHTRRHKSGPYCIRVRWLLHSMQLRQGLHTTEGRLFTLCNTPKSCPGACLECWPGAGFGGFARSSVEMRRATRSASARRAWSQTRWPVRFSLPSNPVARQSQCTVALEHGCEDDPGERETGIRSASLFILTDAVRAPHPALAPLLASPTLHISVSSGARIYSRFTETVNLSFSNSRL